MLWPLYCMFSVATCTTYLHDSAGVPRCDDWRTLPVATVCHRPDRPHENFHVGACGAGSPPCTVSEQRIKGRGVW